MAIVSKLTELDWFFKAYPILEEMKQYMLNATLSTHEIYKRISQLTLKKEQNYREVIYPLGYGARAIEQTYRLKPKNNAFFETHRTFIDFQLVVEGYEYMFIGDKSEFDIKIPYDESKDLIVYENALPQSLYSTSKQNIPLNYPDAPSCTSILLKAGDLAIFFPNDVHAGGLELMPKTEETPKEVKKTVLKIPTSLLL